MAITIIVSWIVKTTKHYNFFSSQVSVDILSLYNSDAHTLLWAKYIHLPIIDNRCKACMRVILIMFNIPWESYFQSVVLHNNYCSFIWKTNKKSSPSFENGKFFSSCFLLLCPNFSNTTFPNFSMLPHISNRNVNFVICW